MTKPPKASMTWPAASVPLWPFGQDEAGRGEVQRQPQHRRDQQHGGEGGELERLLDEQRRHQDQHREDDRDREAEVEHQRRQRQDQHDQDGDNAEGQRDVALPSMAIDLRAERAPPRR